MNFYRFANKEWWLHICYYTSIFIFAERGSVQTLSVDGTARLRLVLPGTGYHCTRRKRHVSIHHYVGKHGIKKKEY